MLVVLNIDRFNIDRFKEDTVQMIRKRGNGSKRARNATNCSTFMSEVLHPVAAPSASGFWAPCSPGRTRAATTSAHLPRSHVAYRLPRYLWRPYPEGSPHPQQPGYTACPEGPANIDRCLASKCPNTCQYYECFFEIE